jgi:hypothetical protein
MTPQLHKSGSMIIRHLNQNNDLTRNFEKKDQFELPQLTPTMLPGKSLSILNEGFNNETPFTK